MIWWSILKREFKIFDGNPPAFMVSLMSSKKNRDRLRDSEIKIYGDNNYVDMVDFKKTSISSFIHGEQMMALMEMDNIVVVTDSKGTFDWKD